MYEYPANKLVYIQSATTDGTVFNPPFHVTEEEYKRTIKELSEHVARLERENRELERLLYVKDMEELEKKYPGTDQDIRDEIDYKKMVLGEFDKIHLEKNEQKEEEKTIEIKEDRIVL